MQYILNVVFIRMNSQRYTMLWEAAPRNCLRKLFRPIVQKLRVTKGFQKQPQKDMLTMTAMNIPLHTFLLQNDSVQPSLESYKGNKKQATLYNK